MSLGLTCPAAPGRSRPPFASIIFYLKSTLKYNIAFYLIEGKEEDLKNGLLKRILVQGQESKEFQKSNPQVIATIIQGAISESMLTNQNDVSTEEYIESLVNIVLKIIK